MRIGYGKAAIWGLVAGVIMAMFTMMITWAMGMGFLTMLAMIAAVLAPTATIGGAGLGVLVLGALIHMALSMMFGVLYAVIVNSVTHEFVGTGIAVGLGLWLVNFYILGLVIPGAHMMAQHEPVWLAAASHLIFGFTLGVLSRTSASALRPGANV